MTVIFDEETAVASLKSGFILTITKLFRFLARCRHPRIFIATNAMVQEVEIIGKVGCVVAFFDFTQMLHSFLPSHTYHSTIADKIIAFFWSYVGYSTACAAVAS